MRSTAFSLSLLLCACSPAGDPSDPGPGGKADDAWDAPSCSAEDAETVSLCLSEGCPDLEGDALEVCLQETCGEDLERIDAICEDCVIGGVAGGSEPFEAAANCSSTGPVAGTCSDENLEWLFFCRDEGCAGLAGDELEACLLDTCGAEIEAAPEDCRGCFVFYSDAGAGAEHIEEQCGRDEEPAEPACTGEDAQAVSLCLSDGCPDQTGTSLEICLQETCGEDLDRAAPECSTCVFENVDFGHSGVIETCLP